MKKNKMICSIGQKTLVFCASIFLLSIFVFFVARLAPGDPLEAYYGDRVERMSVQERMRAEMRLGLHDPIAVQYGRWLENAAAGDFGISYKYKQDVLDVIAARRVLSGEDEGCRAYVERFAEETPENKAAPVVTPFSE